MNVSWEDLGWERLAAGVGRRRLPGWDATCGLIVGTEGVLLYDTGSTLTEGTELRVQVETLLAGRHVTHIALSHPHFDHVMGTAAFPGAEVFGAVGLDALLRREREELRSDAVRHGVDGAEAARSAELLVAPGHLVTGERMLDLGGGRRVLLANVGPGHTGHDLAVLVPGEPEVVFCGDLVEESGEPQAGPDAIGARWPAALDRLLALGGEDAAYVPGHGAVVDAAFVRAQRAALAERFAVS
ncbi:MBL fold metallo-hydrolase [Streptomyces clavuligerus]|uniref:Metallo-beta-lactamase n=1 Tax=Streptomyces clavuligerus TaxID=1901 RepID=B5H0H7_STRCL|nr:MBL fold metallo-hydrolase [Streptomyces clavuligerus]ANW20263.1 MBL fold metallo-hydrolase [Streptomyces clavuligerus]AXU14887.1 MBL fold metallo-hydrolase [Streptomyces clavuligerus]EDY52073.1 metallo-beta-lactamase [Streptomyces clavuligerus]EFG06805.1 Metallo-beta-lactamase [Streptomyces clavuligerus]MBY6304929.1 MBL fold metallo-hydrolase [Streptomyces clavuligerus]